MSSSTAETPECWTLKTQKPYLQTVSPKCPNYLQTSCLNKSLVLILRTGTKKNYRIWFLPTSGISSCGISQGQIISVNGSFTTGSLGKLSANMTKLSANMASVWNCRFQHSGVSAGLVSRTSFTVSSISPLPMCPCPLDPWPATYAQQYKANRTF